MIHGRVSIRPDLDQADDPPEVGRQGVPRRIHRHLAAVQQRVREADLVGHDADEHQPARVGDESNAPHIDLALLPVASNTTGYRLPSVSPRSLRRSPPASPAAAPRAARPSSCLQKSSRCSFRSSTVIVGAGELDELDDRQPDRPGADDEARCRRPAGRRGRRRGSRWPASRPGPVARASAFRTCGACGPGTTKRGRRPPSVWTPRTCRFSQQFGRPRAGRRSSLLAVHVRLDRAAVARPDVRHAGADGEDFDAEFVAGDARVAVERHLAEVAADVGAADADPVDADDAPRRGRGSAAPAPRSW